MENTKQYTVEAHALRSLAANNADRILIGKVDISAKNATHARAKAARILKVPDVYWQMPQGRVMGDLIRGRRGPPLRIVDLRVKEEP